MSRPLLLWVDCTSGLPDAELRVRSAKVFDVLHVQGAGQAAAQLARTKLHAICFDFDYPDQACLRALQVIKQTYPRLPILMITLEHSEALAVFAFRARVWNYLVKPVSAPELAENLTALANLGGRASPPRAAQVVNAALPRDLRVQSVAPEVARLQPALHYVTKHYHERVSANAAARACGLTRFEFSRRFHAAFGTTFRDYVLRVRIMEARRMLTEGRVSVTGVAYSVGFNDGSHFAQMFRRFTGVLPSAYRVEETQASCPASDSNGEYPGLRRRSSDGVISSLTP